MFVDIFNVVREHQRPVSLEGALTGLAGASRSEQLVVTLIASADRIHLVHLECHYDVTFRSKNRRHVKYRVLICQRV